MTPDQAGKVIRIKSTVPSCADCTHNYFRFGDLDRTCWRNVEFEEREDPVNGLSFSPKFAPIRCRDARAENGECGPEGRLFEPKYPPAKHGWLWYAGWAAFVLFVVFISVGRA